MQDTGQVEAIVMRHEATDKTVYAISDVRTSDGLALVSYQEFCEALEGGARRLEATHRIGEMDLDDDEFDRKYDAGEPTVESVVFVWDIGHPPSGEQIVNPSLVRKYQSEDAPGALRIGLGL